jgi:hypothetical protein
MIIPLISLVGLSRLMLAGGNDGGGGKVKLPASMLFNGQPLLTGPDKGFNIVTHAKKADDAAVLAKSKDGNWYFLWCDSGDGWVHKTTVTVQGNVNSLPVWPPIKGYTYKPEATVTRPTDLKNGFAANYKTLVCIPAGQYTKVLAQSPDTHWLFIWSDMGDGWVPRSAVDTKSDLSYLPTWDKPFQGATQV